VGGDSEAEEEDDADELDANVLDGWLESGSAEF
jgi:hypothetical protein